MIFIFSRVAKVTKFVKFAKINLLSLGYFSILDFFGFRLPNQICNFKALEHLVQLPLEKAYNFLQYIRQYRVSGKKDNIKRFL